MKKKKEKIVFIVMLIILVVVVMYVGRMIEKRTPSKKHASSEEILKIYGLDAAGDDSSLKQTAIVLQDQIVEEKGFLEDGRVYLAYDFIKQELDDHFYWDDHENILLFTTPTDIIKADVGSGEYYVSKVKNEAGYTIVKTKGSTAYIALDFVGQYADVRYSYYENPDRVVILNRWNETVNTATLKKGTALRKSESIKADILYSCPSATEVTVLSKEKKWAYVMTGEGRFGFVQNASLGKETEKTLTSDFKKPEYTRIDLGKTVSLAWHMVTAPAANSKMMDLVTPAKGLNVIAPTWYRLSDADGNVSSFVDASYVTRAHMVGLNVWASIDDQAEGVTDDELFPYTSKREKIINQLIASVIENNIDGISLDIEFVQQEIADDFIEFVRELSVKCRINGIVLSICNKLPENYNRYMNFEAQGEAADYVILMGYDEHWGVGSGAGSVASLPWVENGVKNAVEDVASEKIILAVPFYTRIWTEDADGNVKDCQTVDMDSAISHLAGKGVEAVWVDNFGQNYGEYDNGNGETVRIWLEDTRSIEEKLKLIEKYRLGGMGAWRLGLENADLWNTIIKYTN